ncbi:MAG: glycosyltransferase [Armatimonadota bacterium]
MQETRKLRVAIFCLGTLGGSTEVAVMLAQNLRRRGHECDLYAYSDSYQHRLACDEIDVHTPKGLHYPLFQAIPTDFGFLSRFAEEHARKPYDILHAHYAVPLIHVVSNLALAYDLPCVMTFHGSDVTILPDHLPLTFIPLLIEKAGMEVTAASHFLAAEIHERYGVALERIHIIGNSVSEEFFAPGEPAHEPCRYFLHCSNLRPLKRPADILQALGRLRDAFNARQLPEMPCLKIVGEGPDLPLLEALTEALGIESYVEFCGRIDNRHRLAGLMEASRAVIASSEMESQPLTVLEAMAVGAPVVCASFPSATELLGNQGDRGYVYPVGDVEALTRVMGEIVRTPERARAMARNAFRFVREEHDMPPIIDAYLNLYERMLSPVGV